MFYAKLEEYTKILNTADLRADRSVADIVEALSGVEGLRVATKTEDFVGGLVKETTLEFHNKYGTASIKLRYGADFFVVGKSWIDHDLMRHEIRWWDTRSRFDYALPFKADTVHAFVAALIKAF
ncbi:MAG: hypothetical protein ACRDBQ_18815 [Shewanella sp.]